MLFACFYLFSLVFSERENDKKRFPFPTSLFDILLWSNYNETFS